MGTQLCWAGSILIVWFAFNQWCISMSLLARIKRIINGHGAYCVLPRE